MNYAWYHLRVGIPLQRRVTNGRFIRISSIRNDYARTHTHTRLIPESGRNDEPTLMPNKVGKMSGSSSPGRFKFLGIYRRIRLEIIYLLFIGRFGNGGPPSVLVKKSGGRGVSMGIYGGMDWSA